MSNVISEAWPQHWTTTLAREISPEYFQSKRWFGSKTRTIQSYRVVDIGMLEVPAAAFVLAVLEISYSDADAERYFVPLALQPEQQVPDAIRRQPHGIAFTIAGSDGEVWAYDAFEDDRFCAALYQGMFEDRDLAMDTGTLLFRHIPERITSPEVHDVRQIRSEQSNTSVIFNGELIMKAFRKLSVGRNPDFEVPFYLTTHTDFRYVPQVAGFIEYRGPAGEESSVGVTQAFLINQGDGYTDALNQLREYFAQVLPFIRSHPGYSEQQQCAQAEQYAGSMPRSIQRLGYITGQMHLALASPTGEPNFQPEPISARDTERWEQNIVGLITQVVEGVRGRMPDLPDNLQQLLRPVAEQEKVFLGMVSGLDVLQQEDCNKTRFHGDYHLGQVLRTGHDFMILDFEGEPARSLEERRAKNCPLKDVAGMLRSFDYAAYAILFDIAAKEELDETEAAEVESWALAWEDLARRAFLQGYHEATSGYSDPRFIPADDASFARVVQIFEVEKAFYELAYEFNNRPAWIAIPAQGLLRILENHT